MTQIWFFFFNTDQSKYLIRSLWYFSPNLFWWYHTFQPWENVLTFFCIVMFKICQFLRALIHNVTTAFIRSTHFKNFFFLRTYPVFHSITMWRMTASIFLKIYSIVDANRWIPLCTKITKSYFEKKIRFVGRIITCPYRRWFCSRLFF